MLYLRDFTVFLFVVVTPSLRYVSEPSTRASRVPCRSTPSIRDTDITVINIRSGGLGHLLRSSKQIVARRGCGFSKTPRPRLLSPAKVDSRSRMSALGDWKGIFFSTRSWSPFTALLCRISRHLVNFDRRSRVILSVILMATVISSSVPNADKDIRNLSWRRITFITKEQSSHDLLCCMGLSREEQG